MKTIPNAGNSPTTTIRHTTFAYRIFPVRTTVIHKAGDFSKMASLSTTWFSWFARSIFKPTRIHTKKLGKNCRDSKNQPKCLISRSCCFLHRTQNHARSVLLERRQRRISVNSWFYQIQVREDFQLSAKKRSIGMAKMGGKSGKTQGASNQRSP